MLAYATVPGFYAEVERRADASLASRPVIVGGDPRKRGTVQSATPDAIAAGVAIGMPVVEALEACPRARALRTNMRVVREANAELLALLRRETDRLEPAGLGAAYLDLGGGDEAPEEVAGRLCQRAGEQLRLPLRVGLAPLKFLAKIAAEHPDNTGVLCVRGPEVRSFLDALPIQSLPGVGPNTAATLAEMSLHRVADLRAASREALEARLGNHGLAILALAQGRDPSGVRAAAAPRTLSQETTLPHPDADRGALGAQISALALRLEATLARERLAAKRITLKVRYADGDSTTRSRTVNQAVFRAPDLDRLTQELFDRTQPGRRVRGFGLAVALLVRARRDDRQLDLFAGRR
jgi:nucleotidyltransferase/DNA polymerase involved in DNA repair